jgi:hypothetical protein
MAVFERYKKIYRRYPKDFMNKPAGTGSRFNNPMKSKSKKLISNLARFLQIATYEDC